MKSLAPNDGLKPNNLAPEDRAVYDAGRVVELEEQIEILKAEVKAIKDANKNE